MNLQMTDKEERAIIDGTLKMAKLGAKHFETVKEMFWHEDDVVELWWRSGMNSVSILSNGDATVSVDGMDEKQVTQAMAKKIVLAIANGTDRGIVQGMMVRAKEVR